MTPHFSDDWLTVYAGDSREVLRELPSDSVDCVVTSPPYWGLRDYGTATWEGGDAECEHRVPATGSTMNKGNNNREGKPFPSVCGRCGASRVDSQLGLERTPEEYVANMVAVFAEVRRVLKPSGTCWLNLGDSYNGSGKGGNGGGSSGLNLGKQARENADYRQGFHNEPTKVAGLKPKDLVGIPWRVAFALQQPYYTGTIKDERDRIWLAAMLDAEGCLFIQKRKAGQHNGQGYYRQNDNYGPGVEIANTSRAVVERVMELVGKGSISTQEGGTFGRKQTLYRWNLRTTECRDFVRELYPHLVAKQQQARILIGCPPSGERAEAAHAALMALHKTGISDVDFPAPASMYEPGWYLRSDIVWSKSNPMPESVTDRPTKSHEYLFLLTKSSRYFFDADAVREPSLPSSIERMKSGWNDDEDRDYVNGKQNHLSRYIGTDAGMERALAGRNIRSVWNIATRPYPGAHFAVFPPELPERCIKAGSSEKGVCPVCGAPWERVVERTGEVQQSQNEPGTSKKHTARGVHGSTSALVSGFIPIKETTGWRPTCDDDAAPAPAVVLDPFAGSGTVGMVANRLSRRAILIDLNPDYIKQQMKRNAQTPLGLSAGDAA